ncbi:hypothetical protein K438DRAFT_1987653 [Mycena galopus ATCC 62051]|nr:hypothetical protein K438DRAFT_1987653 [Mycena galopus ATCC 62051]
MRFISVISLTSVLLWAAYATPLPQEGDSSDLTRREAALEPSAARADVFTEVDLAAARELDEEDSDIEGHGIFALPLASRPLTEATDVPSPKRGSPRRAALIVPSLCARSLDVCRVDFDGVHRGGLDKGYIDTHNLPYILATMLVPSPPRSVHIKQQKAYVHPSPARALRRT